MFSKKLYLSLVSAAALFLGLPNHLPGQTTFGSIVGTIADPSGAPIT